MLFAGDVIYWTIFIVDLSQMTNMTENSEEMVTNTASFV